MFYWLWIIYLTVWWWYFTLCVDLWLCVDHKLKIWRKKMLILYPEDDIILNNISFRFLSLAISMTTLMNIVNNMVVDSVYGGHNLLICAKIELSLVTILLYRDCWYYDLTLHSLLFNVNNQKLLFSLRDCITFFSHKKYRF